MPNVYISIQKTDIGNQRTGKESIEKLISVLCRLSSVVFQYKHAF